MNVVTRHFGWHAGHLSSTTSQAQKKLPFHNRLEWGMNPQGPQAANHVCLILCVQNSSLAQVYRLLIPGLFLGVLIVVAAAIF